MTTKIFPVKSFSIEGDELMIDSPARIAFDSDEEYKAAFEDYLVKRETHGYFFMRVQVFSSSPRRPLKDGLETSYRTARYPVSDPAARKAAILTLLDVMRASMENVLANQEENA